MNTTRPAPSAQVTVIADPAAAQAWAASLSRKQLRAVHAALNAALKAGGSAKGGV